MISRFPFHAQHDYTSCGPACLQMISEYHGISLDQSLLHEKCSCSKGGSSFLDLCDAAEDLGFRTVAAKISWRQLSVESPLPCIIHWNSNHFVVVYRIRSSRRRTIISVADPALGLLEYESEDFRKYWIPSYDKADSGDLSLGYVLFLEPTPAFLNNETGVASFNHRSLLLYLRPYTHNFIQIIVSILVATLLNMILPFTTQTIVDRGIGLQQLSIITTMLIAQVSIISGQMMNNVIKGWLTLHTSVRVSVSLISDFLRKLMRLPISFFEARQTGDIMQRIQDHNRIQSFLTGSLLSFVSSAVLFIVYSFILGGYDRKILLIFIIGTILYISWVLLFLNRRKRLDYLRFLESSANQSNIVQLVEVMPDIKLNNCENRRRREWEDIQARLFNVNVKSLATNQLQQTGGSFIDQIKNVILSYMAAKSVISGDMTLGMMTSLQYILGQLNAPVAQFVSFIQEAQDAGISMERLGEIHGMEEEEPIDSAKRQKVPSDVDIAFENVSFEYGKSRVNRVLKDFNLHIPHGKTTAIVGMSGSGKTTILKLLLGFYKPSKGEIMLGSIPLSEYSESRWRAQCGCVMQDGHIISDTIAENISMSNEEPDMDKVRSCAEVACLLEWVDSLPKGFNTKIGGCGNGISVGQRQRILIARALYKNSSIILLDEATNSLDANNEAKIMENLSYRFKGKTVIVIAHRLSTIRDADKIVVLEHGRIVEEGNNESLLRLRGKYYNLVRRQVEFGEYGK